MKQLARISLIGDAESGISKTTGMEWRARNIILTIREEDGFDSTLRMRVTGAKLDDFDRCAFQPGQEIVVDIRMTNENHKGFISTGVWVKSFEKVNN